MNLIMWLATVGLPKVYSHFRQPKVQLSGLCAHTHTHTHTHTHKTHTHTHKTHTHTKHTHTHMNTILFVISTETLGCIIPHLLIKRQSTHTAVFLFIVMGGRDTTLDKYTTFNQGIECQY